MALFPKILIDNTIESVFNKNLTVNNVKYKLYYTYGKTFSCGENISMNLNLCNCLKINYMLNDNNCVVSKSNFINKANKFLLEKDICIAIDENFNQNTIEETIDSLVKKLKIKKIEFIKKTFHNKINKTI